MNATVALILVLLLQSTGQSSTLHARGENKIELRVEGDFVVVKSKVAEGDAEKPFEFRIPRPANTSTAAEEKR